jgi:hypothetical protein
LYTDCAIRRVEKARVRVFCGNLDGVVVYFEPMSDGKHCPACGKDIGIWPVLSAGLPSRVRCPHCKSRLSYGSGLSLLLIALIVLVLVVCVGIASYYLASQHLAAGSRVSQPIKFYGIVAGVFLALWLPVWLPLEIGLTLYIRSRGELKKAE